MSATEVTAALDLFEVAPCGYLFTSPDGTITRVNTTFLQWTGYSLEDLVGCKRFQELLTRPAAIFYETHFAPLLQMQGYVREISAEFLCTDGTTFPALVNSTIHRDESGRPLLLLTTIFDIRDRRRYERELLLQRTKAEQWAQVVARTTEPVMTVDAQLRLTSWNPAAESLFGYPAARVLGRDFRQLLLRPEERERFEALLAQLRSGSSSQEELFLLDSAGSPIDTVVSFTPHVEPVDDFQGFSAIIRDLRARRQMYKAQEMERDLQLANELAHEINNPLQAIINCMVLLQATGNHEYIRQMEENLMRIAQVITRLVQLTRS
jgi:PAS domain S-box-containing protein